MNKYFSLFVLFFLFVFDNKVFAANRTLKYVMYFFRHGDRTPLSFFPNDPNNALNTWDPPGYGLLTAQGMKQHFALGQSFQQRYITDMKFMGKEYNRTELYVRSTDVDRTMQSVLSQLASFFVPSEQDRIVPDLPWAPIPVHIYPQLEDYLMRAFDPNVCPTLTKMINDWVASDEFVTKDNANKPLFDNLKQITGFTYNLANVSGFRDTVVCQRAHNRTILPSITPDIINATEDLVQWVLSRIYSQQRARLAGGFMIQQLITVVQSIMNKNIYLSDVGQKMSAYSGHDSTISALLSSLGIYDGKPPQYAAYVAFEVYYNNDDQKYYIDILYNGVPMTLPSCQTSCPFDTFVKITAANTPTDYSECTISNSSETLSTGARAAIIVTLIVAVALLMFAIWYACKKMNIRKYDKVATTETIPPDAPYTRV